MTRECVLMRKDDASEGRHRFLVLYLDRRILQSASMWRHKLDTGLAVAAQQPGGNGIQVNSNKILEPNHQSAHISLCLNSSTYEQVSLLYEISETKSPDLGGDQSSCKIFQFPTPPPIDRELLANVVKVLHNNHPYAPFPTSNSCQPPPNDPHSTITAYLQVHITYEHSARHFWVPASLFNSLDRPHFLPTLYSLISESSELTILVFEFSPDFVGGGFFKPVSPWGPSPSCAMVFEDVCGNRACEGVEM